MLQNEVFRVLLEIIFGLPLDEVLPAVNVLLYLEKLFDELFERSAINISKFPNQDRVEHPQVAETL